MTQALLLAWRYVAFHKVKTAILVACITLTAYLPVVVHGLLARLEDELTARAAATPLVVGAKGSRFDLVLHALYFQTAPPDTIPYSEVNTIRTGGLATPIPLYVRYTARGAPIVGSSLNYFSFRDLEIAAGNQITRLGDCVLGANVARRLGLGPGDHLLSDSQNVFDIAGTYPLKMRITGVLQPAHGPDDDAVFVDVKTAWVIEGLGHGHEDLTTSTDDSVVLRRDEDKVVANAALVQYTEITDANLGGFHFHGDISSFPISAVIALPPDDKSSTILIGRYDSQTAAAQVVSPAEVVADLMGMLFQVKRFFDVNVILVAVATVLFLVLVILLSLRLRRREMQTMFKLGCSRLTIFRLQAAELGIILAASLLIVSLLAAVTLQFTPQIVRAVLLG
jgi:putative ABC transport system permease protein